MVSTETIAHPAHKPTSYVEKGRRLFSARFGEVTYLGRGRWLVPSSSTEGRHYEVDAGGQCECLGSYYAGHCCHDVAACLARAKTDHCAICGGRFLYRDLTETDDGFGMLACRGCA
jgi:hypothetical protein